MLGPLAAKEKMDSLLTTACSFNSMHKVFGQMLPGKPRFNT